MKPASTALIIHIFAILHACVALLCNFAGVEDELILTILTMLMTLLICRKEKMNIELTAASIIIVNIIGYLVGNLGADFLRNIISEPSLVPAVSTTITTEILGWSIVGLTRIFLNENIDKSTEHSDYQLKWAVIAISGVLALRVFITLVFSHSSIESSTMVNAFLSVFSNSIAVISLFCVNIIYIWYHERLTKRLSTFIKSIFMVGFCGIVTLLMSLIVFWMTSAKFLPEYNFASLFVAILMTQIALYCIVWMIHYALTSSKKLQRERGKANLAEYRYLKLKHQVNPHFLFNSLNILDCLVCEEQTEKASEYIHKLAGIYRYMIKSEDEELVPLRDEMAFVEKYIELLHVRFPEGFRVDVNIEEKYLNKYVLPCAIQLLIENATKHNAVNTKSPLIIKVEADDTQVWVSNNIIPKYGKIESIGLGQKYLRQQYLDLSGKEISIEQSANEFKVTLPLI